MIMHNRDFQTLLYEAFKTRKELAYCKQGFFVNIILGSLGSLKNFIVLKITTFIT